MCYDLTKSTPGFAANPNNCQKFYMCEPDGQGGWIPYNMTCPACTFWDQDKLSCVEVYQDLDHTGVCGNFTEVTGVTLATHSKLCLWCLILLTIRIIIIIIIIIVAYVNVEYCIYLTNTVNGA